MIIRLYRRALLALRQHFSRAMRNSISRKWLLSAKHLADDAAEMSPVKLTPTDTTTNQGD